VLSSGPNPLDTYGEGFVENFESVLGSEFLTNYLKRRIRWKSQLSSGRVHRERSPRWPKSGFATFNLENFDEIAPDEWPSRAERIQLMRPQIVRLRANIACFQEVNGQERPNQPRSLLRWPAC
jgi:hypothetical protein